MQSGTLHELDLKPIYYLAPYLPLPAGKGWDLRSWVIIGHIAHRRALALTILGRSCAKLFKLVHINVHVHNKRSY